MDKTQEVKQVVLEYFKNTRCENCKIQEQEDIKMIDALINAVKQLNEK